MHEIEMNAFTCLQSKLETNIVKVFNVSMTYNRLGRDIKKAHHQATLVCWPTL